MTLSFHTSSGKVFRIFSAPISHAFLGKRQSYRTNKNSTESALEEAKSSNGERENAKY